MDQMENEGVCPKWTELDPQMGCLLHGICWSTRYFMMIFVHNSDERQAL
jgi:hypothetical protein